MRRLSYGPLARPRVPPSIQGSVPGRGRSCSGRADTGGSRAARHDSGAQPSVDRAHGCAGIGGDGGTGNWLAGHAVRIDVAVSYGNHAELAHSHSSPAPSTPRFAPTADPKVATARVSSLAAPVVAGQVALGHDAAHAAVPPELGSLFAGGAPAAAQGVGAPR